MKNVKRFAGAMMLLAIFTITIISCKKDPDNLTLSTLTANGVDLNGASSATGVDVDAVITAIFSSDVDASTATASNITLVRNLDGTSLPIDISVSGATVTITPQDILGSGTLYELTFGSNLKSTDGGYLTAITRSFTSAGTYAPSDVFAYWNFDDGTPDAVVGGYTASEATAVTYIDSGHNALSGKAAQFNGTTTYIEYPNIGPELMNTHSFSLSFWVYADTVNHVDGSGNKKGYFVMGTGFFKGFQFEIDNGANYIGSCKLAAQYDLDTITGSEDLWFPADGNLGWQGWTFCKDLTGSGGLAAIMKNTWANVVCEYDGDTKVGSMYINGELMKQQDFNLWPLGDPKTGCIGLIFDPNATDVGHGFVLGFAEDKSSTLFATETWGNPTSPDSNHFQGMLDDVRVYHRALTLAEIQLMYNSSK